MISDKHSAEIILNEHNCFNQHSLHGIYAPICTYVTSLSILGKLVCICFVLWLYCVVCWLDRQSYTKIQCPSFPFCSPPPEVLQLLWMSAYPPECLDWDSLVYAGSRSQTRISDVTSCHKEFPYKLLESVHHILINDYYAKSCCFISISVIDDHWTSLNLLIIQTWTLDTDSRIGKWPQISRLIYQFNQSKLY